MRGAIYYSGHYGSTAEYAEWISEATGLPTFDIKDRRADPTAYDFVVLGSSVIVFKLTIRKWIRKHLSALMNRPVILFTVSGAGPGPKLEAWIVDCLPAPFVAHIQHVGLRGRQNPKTVNLWHRLILIIGAWKNKDPQASKEEREGFDYMDKSSIDPIVARVRELTASSTA